MATKFNEAQLLAIEARCDNILVAAGAGSGKSTVLVERLMRKIVLEEIGIDQFLIVTFTNLAAREMIEKLRESLNDALAENPNSQHLQTQLLKLPYADISTFHGFCNKILQRYYYLIEMDVNMQLMDDLEAVMLRQEVLKEFFDMMYENTDFQTLVDVFGSDRSDEPLANLLIKIYEIARANPDMEKWLNDFTKLYEMSGDTIDGWQYYELISELTFVQLGAAVGQIEKARELAISAQMDEVEHGYLLLYDQDLALIDAIKNAVKQSTYDQVRDLIMHTKPASFPRIKKQHWDEEIHKQSSDTRKKFIAIIDTLGKDFYAYTNATQAIHFKRCGEIVANLARMVTLFHHHFALHKKELSKLDFSDLERLTLEILTNNHDVLKEVATDFVEIMIDEYQDTNEMQERIVGLIADALHIPMFMVGDVKQSIYRFRLAEPGIFQQKYLTYQAMENNNLKIDLMQNYRSSSAVINATNYIFAQLMDVEVGEIAYDVAAMLKLGITTDPANKFNQPELQILNKEEIVAQNSEYKQATDAELEAHFIAQKIVEMTTNSTIFDRKKGLERPICYDDIVILMRSMSASMTFYEILTNAGIPVAVETAGNLLEETEIITILSALRIIDNPYQDIPLAAVMRSPLFFFTEPELAAIRVGAKRGVTFYESVKTFAANSDADLYQKIQDFLMQLKNWRYTAKGTTIAGLLQNIYETTSYYEFVLGIQGGQLRRANLDLLVTTANQYETRTTLGLDDFIRYLDQLQKIGKGIPKAKLQANTAGVKIMTIHKSKGLEFPVVFVAGLQKKFNTQDEIGNYVIHKNFGIGLQYIDPVLRLKQKTLPIILLAKVMRNEMLAEEMRLLYVALTRSKSKLILTGVMKDQAKIAELAAEEIAPTYARRNANRYLDWVLPIITQVSANNPWKLAMVTALESENVNFNKIVTTIKAPPIIDFDAIFARTYPLAELTTITAKQSVTQRKIEETVPLYRGIPERMETPVYDQPSFIKNDTKATEIGTAFHHFMQHLPVELGHSPQTLTALKDDLVKRNIIRTELATKLNLTDIYNFTQSQLYVSVTKAKSIQKELPFTMIFAAGNDSLAKALLQGVVDLLAEFDDEVWIIDYKTDRVTDFDAEINFLKKRYDIQMKYYLAAMKELFPEKRVVAKVYFMRAGRFVEYQ